MILQLTKSLKLYLSRPIWLEVAAKPQLELSLGKGLREVNIPKLAEGYMLRVFKAGDEEKLAKLFSAAGFHFSSNELLALFMACLPAGCFVVEHLESKDLVATMMARHHSSEDYPFGGRIDWLATNPDHRNKGLGSVCASAATQRLLEAGYTNIWVTTDDFRLGAIKIFLGIGFQPVKKNNTELRWQEALKKLNLL